MRLRDYMAVAKLYVATARLFDPRTCVYLTSLWLRWLLTWGRRLKQDKRETSPLHLFLLFFSQEQIVHFKSCYVIHSQLPPLPSKAFDNIALPPKPRHLSMSRPLYPSFAHIAITYDCPLNCWFCSADGHTHPKDDLGLDAWGRIIQQLQNVGVFYIGITGGEPLMRSDLEEIIASIDQRSVIALGTSGFDLTLERAKCLRDAGLFYMLVGLDHPQPEVHDDFRGRKGAYQAAVKALCFSKEVGLYTIMQTLVTREFVAQKTVWEMARIGRELGIQEIRLSGIKPSGRVLRIKNWVELLLTEEDQQRLMGDILHIKNDQSYPKVSFFEDFEHPTRFGCSAGSLHAYIDGAGNVCPCDFVPMRFGNLCAESFEEIWKRVQARLGVSPTKNLACFASDRIASYDLSSPLSPEHSQPVCQRYRISELPGVYLKPTSNA